MTTTKIQAGELELPDLPRGGAHRTGTAGEDVRHLIARREYERLREDHERIAKEHERQLRRNGQDDTEVISVVPAETELERTQPLDMHIYLLRCGDPEIVLRILDGRGITEQVIDTFVSQDCEFCTTEKVQPTSVRLTASAEHAECCARPECFHAALRTVDRDLSDRDVVVEIARRPTVVLG